MEADFTGGLPRICRGPRNSGPAIPMHIPERRFSAGLLAGAAEKPERPGEVGRSEPMEADFTGGLPRTCRGPRNSGPAIPMHIPQRHFSAGLLVALASLGQLIGGRSVSLMPSACFSAKPWASRRPNRPRASPDAPYSRPRAFRMASSRGSITTASPAACMAARTSLSPLPVLRTTMRSSGCTLPCATALTRPA